MSRHLTVVAALALLATVAAAPARAAGFPPITDAERALTAVPWDPGAPAVVLFRKATIKLQDYPKDVSSTLDAQVRIKILSPEGLRFGEIAIEHSRLLRLKNLSGRTVLPDGRVVPLADDAVFVDQTSRTEKTYTTKAAFPAVEVGAIVEYSYRLYWDSFFFLEPWQFDDVLPTVLSEVTFLVPGNLGVKPWGRQTPQNPMQSKQDRTSQGTQIKVWVEKLPALAEEAFSSPAADRSSRFMLVPTRVVLGGSVLLLFDSWKSTCDLFANDYQEALRKDRKARQRALELAGAGDRDAKARALYRFVRDEIQTRPDLWVGIRDSTVDKVLEERRGTPAEKALLLSAMLDAAGVKSRLVWAPDRTEGKIDTEVASPWWFDRMLVMIEPGAERVFLDPSNRHLGYGNLEPAYEGTPALVFDRTKPELITLPAAPFDRNARSAVIALAVDADGRTAGTGSLAASGHHALQYLGWGDGDKPASEVWGTWLTEKFKGFEVTAVTVEEAADEQRIRIGWALAERPDQVMGDEVTLAPSRPLGPIKQLLTLPLEKRRTPVQIAFADRDEVELTVSWPPGWEIDAKPPEARFENGAGTLVATTEVDVEGRRIRYQRRLDVVAREFLGGNDYQAARRLFTEAERHDAQDLVLARR